MPLSDTLRSTNALGQAAAKKKQNASNELKCPVECTLRKPRDRDCIVARIYPDCTVLYLFRNSCEFVADPFSARQQFSGNRISINNYRYQKLNGVVRLSIMHAWIWLCAVKPSFSKFQFCTLVAMEIVRPGYEGAT